MEKKFFFLIKKLTSGNKKTVAKPWFEESIFSGFIDVHVT